ncbi:MAG TPA: hypothetical protein VHA53_12325 [Nitrolancea sp.]|nr:hypothetical protein [Nitrolancea sp.]
MHIALEDLFQVKGEFTEISNIAARFELDEEIDVAVRSRICSGHRAKQVRVFGAMFCCGPQDLIALGAYVGQSDDVVARSHSATLVALSR